MEVLITELKKLLTGGTAHVGLQQAVSAMSFELLGERPHGLPYSIWQLVEHIRITQWDMLEFCKNPGHKSPRWPDEYWPLETAPEDTGKWDAALKQIADDLTAFIDVLQTNDLYQPIPWGTGQNILREALQIADHTAYHVAEIVVIRRLLGIWKT